MWPRRFESGNTPHIRRPSVFCAEMAFFKSQMGILLAHMPVIHDPDPPGLLVHQQEFPCANNLNHRDLLRTPLISTLDPIIDPRGYWLPDYWTRKSPFCRPWRCTYCVQIQLRYHIPPSPPQKKTCMLSGWETGHDEAQPNRGRSTRHHFLTESGREHWRRLPDAGCHQRPKAEGAQTSVSSRCCQ